MYIEWQKAAGCEIDVNFAAAAWEFMCENSIKRDNYVYICFCWGF